MTQREANRTIAAVERSYAIVQELGTRGEYGVSELAEAMGIPKSTVYKHLATLEAAGYVRKRNRKYRLSFKYLKHGGAVRDNCRLYTFGRPKVEALASEIDEMVILSIRDGDRGAFLFRSNDRYNLKRSLPLGERFYLHQNGAGKAMLATLDDTAVEELLNSTGLPAATVKTTTDRATLLAELETISEQGFAINEGERDAEVRAVSVAIRDEQADDVGAISISIPSTSPVARHLDGEYAEVVQQVASELSLQLRHS